MASNLINVATLIDQLLDSSNSTKYKEKTLNNLLLKEHQSKDNEYDLAIKEFLVNIRFLFNSLIKSEHTNKLTLTIEEINEINSLLHLTNFVINNTEKAIFNVNNINNINNTNNTNKIKFEPVSLNEDFDDLTGKSISLSSSNNFPVNNSNNTLNLSNNNYHQSLKNQEIQVNFLKKKILNNNFNNDNYYKNYENNILDYNTDSNTINININTNTSSNDLSFLNDIDQSLPKNNSFNKSNMKRFNNKTLSQVNTKNAINLKLETNTEGNIINTNNNPVTKPKRKTKFRLDRVKNKIKTMVNNYIHKNLLLITKHEDIFLFKLPKDVVQRIKIHKHNNFYTKSIKVIYSAESLNPKEIKRTLHNASTVNSCLNHQFQKYLSKTYQELMAEYISSLDYVKDINELAQREESEYIALLKKILTKTCQ